DAVSRLTTAVKRTRDRGRSAEASTELDVDRGADHVLQLLGQRLDHRAVAHVGTVALGAAPGHRLALVAPVGPRPPAHRGLLPAVRQRLPLDARGQLPADRGLPLDR